MLKIYNYFIYAWYRYPGLFILLWPFSLVYRFIIFIRSLCYQANVLKKYRAPIPVIVVGNFVVGGTGKTPMVINLAKLLLANGYKPGIITRGYGSNPNTQNLWVTKDTDPKLAGDEPVLMALQTGCPVVKNKNRVEAVKQLIEQCDIIISDDGLQHYALISDIKIAMQPDKNDLNNNFLLPAGPWREPKQLLTTVDFVRTSSIAIDSIYALNNPSQSFTANTAHAVCAIAAPWRFFKLLNDFGIKTFNHAYPDHYLLTENNLKFTDNVPVLITEKDAVKCQHLDLPNVWVVKIKTSLDDAFINAFLDKVKSLRIRT